MGVLQDMIPTEVINDMSEGVMLLGLNGVIRYLNPAAERILDIYADGCADKKLSEVFFTRQENDEFVQLILDAVYDAGSKHAGVVNFYSGDDGEPGNAGEPGESGNAVERVRHLRVQTSYLTIGEQKSGVIVMLDDITELAELKIEYAQKITLMLDSFVQALSTAIEERSNYNANHTRNMVRMASAFIDWLNKTDQDLTMQSQTDQDPTTPTAQDQTNQSQTWHFDEVQKHAFLMSIWLHDVGKLIVPLEIMDKATRLGAAVEQIDGRFDRIRLLDRICLLEGKITQAEYDARQEERSRILNLIHRIDRCGFLSDEDAAAVLRMAELTYTEEDGAQTPLLTKRETDMLLIRRGTLTEEERRTMQSHVAVTRRILSQVHFPEEYASVTEWASEHHELLNGTGYPDHKAEDVIPREVRLLTILDIFEALTAKDRPYKKPVPVPKAFEILHGMALEGSVDGTVLALFEKSRAWEEAS